MNSSLGILWQACPGGARILRVFGDSPCPALPVQIEGFPVVEIGPYCFAQNQRSQPADARFWSVDGRGPAAYPHPIAGDFVQGVTLPAGVRALHNAAFYNCRKLEWLCAGSALESVGSDLFTNCRALDRFILDAAPDAPTGLKKLVAAVSADIGAVFAPGGAVQAKVFYPEYFEFLDENTPAHIFNHSIEGEGYRYRQCFDGSVLRFAEYDAAFPQACVGESEKKALPHCAGSAVYPVCPAAGSTGHLQRLSGRPCRQRRGPADCPARYRIFAAGAEAGGRGKPPPDCIGLFPVRLERGRCPDPWRPAPPQAENL